MKNQSILLLLCLGQMLVSCANKTNTACYDIIPLPQNINCTSDNAFKLNGRTKIVYPENNAVMQRNAEFLADYIRQSTSINVQVQTAPAKNAIVLGLDTTISNREGYRLTVSAKQTTVNGATEAGVFYGIQTLRKSLPMVNKCCVYLPAVEVNDAPRFGYRGMHLDVSRHFFSPDFVKRYIDMLVLHNMNTFHWHLTDDQGWRIEIKQYPKLTEIGAFRKETVIEKKYDEPYDGTPHGGFYTQEEAREIVRYAAERHINVIPEIDMPGHMQAALAAYPELGCTGGPYEVWTRWGISKDVLCAGNPQTLEFAKNVLTEIAALFPSEYIHVGGDECLKKEWEKCPKCQAQIKKLGLKTDDEHTAEQRLQSYFISEVERHINGLGKKMIGWDEILEGGVAPNATVMSWRGMKGGLAAARQHHDVIMSPNTYVYFDYYQSADKDNEPFAIGGFLPLDSVYSLEPVPAALTSEEQKYIIGVQANVWTEFIATTDYLEYMVLPRMAAVAEVQWTQSEKKNYDDFLLRLNRMRKCYDKNGYYYAKHAFER